MSVAYAAPPLDPVAASSVDRPAAALTAPALAGATWGGLLGEASRALRVAAVALRAGPLPNRSATVEAMQAYADLALALAAAWQALWAAAAPRPVATSELDAHLRAGRPAGLRSLGPPTAAASALHAAAVALRASTDLIATHRGPGGRWRSPESSVLARAGVVHGGSGAIAELALAAAPVAFALAAQARSRRIGAAQTARLLGEPRALLAAAGRCRAAAPDLLPCLGDLEVARPGVRHEDPVLQLTDRLRRIRWCCWDLSNRAGAPVATLADVAACATALNAVAAAGGRPTCARPEWLWLRRSLSVLHTVSPPVPLVRGDVEAVRRLLATGVDRIDAAPVVESALRRLPDLARWSASALTRIGADRIYVQGTALRGHEVSDYPELVEAKLAHRIVPVPSRRLAAISAAYAAAAAAPTLSWGRAAHC